MYIFRVMRDWIPFSLSLDGPSEMGDDLVSVDLGSFIPEKLISGMQFHCALSSVANGGELKC